MISGGDMKVLSRIEEQKVIISADRAKVEI